MEISVSFLSIKKNLKKNIEKLDKTDANYIHLDIMDGIFVENKTWSYREAKKLIKHTNKPKDVHLMVKNVRKYVNKFRKLKPEYITFHYESTTDWFDMIRIIKHHNIKAGMSIKPGTDISALEPYLKYLDLVLIMSVEPGKGGQKFIDSTINKVDELYDIKTKNGYKYVIEVDGGINDANYKLLEEHNVDIVVMGSYITKRGAYQKHLDSLK